MGFGRARFREGVSGNTTATGYHDQTSACHRHHDHHCHHHHHHHTQEQHERWLHTEHHVPCPCSHPAFIFGFWFFSLPPPPPPFLVSAGQRRRSTFNAEKQKGKEGEIKAVAQNLADRRESLAQPVASDPVAGTPAATAATPPAAKVSFASDSLKKALFGWKNAWRDKFVGNIFLAVRTCGPRSSTV